MKRREFITFIFAVAMCPLALRARRNPTECGVSGVLMGGTEAEQERNSSCRLFWTARRVGMEEGRQY